MPRQRRKPDLSTKSLQNPPKRSLQRAPHTEIDDSDLGAVTGGGRQSGGSKVKYLTIELEEVVISSVSTGVPVKS